MLIFSTLLLKSLDFNATSQLSLNDSNLIIRKATGSYKSINFNLSGQIHDYMSGDRFGDIQGTLSTSSLDLNLDNPNLNKLNNKIQIKGELTSTIQVSLKTPDIRTCTIKSEFSAKDTKINDIYVNNLHANICFENKSLTIPNITISMYEGLLKGDLAIDLEKFQNPILSTINVRILGINLAHFLGSATKNENNISGILNGSVFLEKTKTINTPNTGKGLLINNFGEYTGKGNLDIEKLWISNLQLSQFSSNFKIEDSVVHFPDISGTLYDGILSGELVLGLANDSAPYNFTSSVTQVDFMLLMKDLTRNNTKNLYGTLDSEIYLKGQLNDFSSIKGGRPNNSS